LYNLKKMNRKVLLTAIFAVGLGAALWFTFSANLQKLSQSLISSDDDRRNLALLEMQKLNSSKRAELITQLITATQNSDPKVRRFALYALRKATPPPEQATPVYIASLHDVDEAVQHEAMISLIEIGAPAAPALVSSLENPNPTIAAGIENALSVLGEPVAPAVIAALSNTNPVIRARSASALGRMTPPAASAKTALTASLKDADETVRRKVAIALNTIDPTAAETVAAHIESIKRAPWDADSFASAHALEMLGVKAKAAAPALVAALKPAPDGFKTLSPRAALGHALGKVDPRRDIVVDLLWDLKHRDAVIRYRAALAFSEMTPPPVGANDGLIKALDDKDRTVARRAMVALTRVGFAGSERFKKTLIDKSVESFAADNGTPPEGYEEAVVAALGTLGHDAVTAALMPTINGKNATLKAGAARLLEKIQKPAVETPANPDEESAAPVTPAQEAP
jgi:HEAT repeat protein